MQALVYSVPTLAVSTIYCLWHLQGERLRRRDRVLRQRVAYMLWVMANEES
ncbi:MAG TPA: hypothetical protein VN688_05900 [Gemmataceae bacterium]|nr:hypothetical protein [Gemmataceae bacterium]